MAKPSLLIVDDEPHLLQSMSSILEEEFHVMTASNGREALSIKKHNPLSLILLDLHMPEMTGVELLEKVRNTDNRTPVFIMTGNSCQDWAEKCADLNVQGYVRKPIDVENLICRIKKLLGMEAFEVLRELWGDDYDIRIAAVSPTIREALHYMWQTYQQDITREKVAGYLNISLDYLSRQFHKECELHLMAYLNLVRVHKSKDLLRDRNMKIKDVAMLIGISDDKYFSRIFKKHTTITPREFRKKLLS